MFGFVVSLFSSAKVSGRIQGWRWLRVRRQSSSLQGEQDSKGKGSGSSRVDREKRDFIKILAKCKVSEQVQKCRVGQVNPSLGIP